MSRQPARVLALARFRCRLALMGRRERAYWMSLSRPQDERLLDCDSVAV